MEEIGSVSKDGTNEYHKYSYAKEVDYVKALKPLLVKYGLTMTLFDQTLLAITEVTTGDDKKTGKYLTTLKSLYKLVNKDDPTDYTQVCVIGQGIDNGDKGGYKAITGGKKYAIANTFLIATEDDPEMDNLTLGGNLKGLVSQANKAVAGDF